MQEIIPSLGIEGGFHLRGDENTFGRERDSSIAVDEILMYFDYHLNGTCFQLSSHIRV